MFLCELLLSRNIDFKNNFAYQLYKFNVFAQL